MGAQYVPLETRAITPSCGDCGWRGDATSDPEAAHAQFTRHYALACILNAAVGYHDQDDWPEDESFHPKMDAAQRVYAILRGSPCHCGEDKHWCAHRQPNPIRDYHGPFSEQRWARDPETTQ